MVEKSDSELLDKDQFLDESFKKAKFGYTAAPLKNKPQIFEEKTPLPKLIIVLIIFTIIGIVVIYQIPWINIFYESNGGLVSVGFDRNLDSLSNMINIEKSDVFHQLHLSTGLSNHDFTTAYLTSFYSFSLLTVLALIVLVFALFERKQILTRKSFLIVHLVAAAVVIPTSLNITFICCKFLSGNFTFYHNSLVSGNIIGLLFPVPYILIGINVLLLYVAYDIFKLDFKEMEEILITPSTQYANSNKRTALGGL